MRLRRLSVTLTSLAFLAAACTSENDAASTPAPHPRPVVDSAPYICKLVPEQAFRLVSGVTEPLMEKTYGGESSGECQDPDASLPPLIVTWLWAGEGTSQEHLDYLLDSRRQLYSRYDGTTLPTDLGKGWAAYLSTSALPDPLYRVSAKFRCDGKDRMIDIYLAQVAEGRDAIKDMIELMRIAQKRYGELYGCTPGT